MRRFGLVWILFGLGVALAAAALARLGAAASALERAEQTMIRQAELEENLQLALWRMDSALAPLIAEESVRPYFTYAPFYPTERAFTCMFAEIKRGEVLVPSPLLTYSSPRIRLHFQFSPDGRIRSPEVPEGPMGGLAEGRYLAPERLAEASRTLAELAVRVGRGPLAIALEHEPPPPPDPALDPIIFANNALSASNGAYPGQQLRQSTEYMMRSRNTKIAQSAQAGRPTALSPRSAPVGQGTLRAVWIGDTLLLARQVRVEEGVFLQGCWLDWEAIRRELLQSVTDLVPGADLVPVRGPTATDPTRTLATLPARLVPGPVLPAAGPSRSPVGFSLQIAWGGLAIAATAVALLLHGALALSERRGSFVSAVTHELRTPLTTFRLYTEMLAEGMVTEAEARRSYLETLRTEADRLVHLVENVLAFARLERGRAISRDESVTCRELLEHLVAPLESRVGQAGMTLEVVGATRDDRLSTDVSVVGQVLTNLVDNAAKYANRVDDRRIRLEAATAGRWLELSVVDHGPGLAPKAARRLFRPFSKSAQEAAHSAPGVGLGLALSRRLARALGGDLRLVENGPEGAKFTLSLPLTR